MMPRCSPEHAVSTVHGGAEALKALCDGNADFDIVLLDLCMPVVDGFEVAVRYRYDIHDVCDFRARAAS